MASVSSDAFGVNVGNVFDGPSDLNNKALAAHGKVNDLTEGEFKETYTIITFIYSYLNSSYMESKYEKQRSH